MRHFTLILGIIFLISFSNHVQGQQKTKVFYLVDTINISKENRAVEISGTSDIFYTFFCQCLEKKNIVFSYLPSRGGPIMKKPPKVDYLSWKSFLHLVDNNIVRFDQKYELYITEVLPNRRYKTSRVYSDWHREMAD